jgi:hypothetical protein
MRAVGVPLRSAALVCTIAHLAAAALPCPQSLPQGAQGAERVTASPSVHAHAAPPVRLNAYGLPVLPINHHVAPTPEEPAQELASLAAVCTCGCGGRPSATPTARLGLALPSAPLATAWKPAPAAASALAPIAPEAPTSTPDHVPIVASPA